VLAEADGGPPELLLLATGSEVWVALAARDRLQAGGVPTRVVSMPCWELFEAQDQAYRDQVLPPDVPARLSVEAASRFGWERWVGDAGEAFGIDHFGASAQGTVVLEKFGFTPDNIAARARAVHERAGRRAGPLDDLPG
jgi:transketolase